MNPNLFAALLTIAAAPVTDPTAPLPITVTPEGRQTLRAHDAPTPRLRRRCAVLASTPTDEPSSSDEC